MRFSKCEVVDCSNNGKDESMSVAKSGMLCGRDMSARNNSLVARSGSGVGSGAGSGTWWQQKVSSKLLARWHLYDIKVDELMTVAVAKDNN